MIEVKNLAKRFEDTQALDGLNINVKKGAVYGLVGPNGAGKTTAIRHIAGIYREDSGEVLIDGTPVWENPEIKGRIAYIPDDIFFFMQASVKDMSKFYGGFYPGFDMQRYGKLKEVFEFDEKRPMRRLSKGMQKQAAFWLALSARPEVLILDEPVDGLDPVMRRRVWSLVMADAAEYGTTVLVSSHNLRELEDVCDHVGIMNAGKILIERGLSEMQGNTVKLQIAMPDGAGLPEGLEILHQSCLGKLTTLIVRGTPEDVTNTVATASPLFADVIPLSLEEIFIYELEGADYAVKDIILQ
ncbi:MAG: ABC transporter ATP-binding protein [Oscillospiraceae bacterium]|nr:ABC transporter ATP-binding protein [Oscillospiraceae bacterium]